MLATTWALTAPPPFDGGPGFDAGPDAGPEPDAGPDAGPPPATIAALFTNTFLVRGAVRLGNGILVVGVDNQGDRDSTASRQALAVFIDETSGGASWASNYGDDEVNDQFLVVINDGPTEALVLGMRAGAIIVSRFDETGLLNTLEFEATAAFITDAVFVGDVLHASGRSGGDAAIFKFDLGAGTMQTSGLGLTGAFNGIAADDEGTIYAAGQTPVGSDAVLAVFPVGEAASTYTLPGAELIGVAAGTGRGAIAVGTSGGAGLRMQLSGSSVTVSMATNISRFRQVELVEGRERYVGITRNGTAFAFAGEREGDDIHAFFVRSTDLTGVSGRCADLRDGGFLVSQNLREVTEEDRVQISRFTSLASLGRSACGRTSEGTLTVSAKRTEDVNPSTRSIEVSSIVGGGVMLTPHSEPFDRPDSCPSM